MSEPAKKPVVLVLEDEPMLMTVYKAKLEMEQFEVIPAVNGKEGLKQFQTKLPDLVITDMVMPEMNGLDFLTNIQDSLKKSAIPVLVFSNVDDTAIKEKCFKLGAKEYILKSSLNISDIVQKVRSYVA